MGKFKRSLFMATDDICTESRKGTHNLHTKQGIKFTLNSFKMKDSGPISA